MWAKIVIPVQSTQMCMLRDLVHQGVHLIARNTLKLAFVHMGFQKFFRELYPQTPFTREGEGEILIMGGDRK